MRKEDKINYIARHTTGKEQISFIKKFCEKNPNIELKKDIELYAGNAKSEFKRLLELEPAEAIDKLLTHILKIKGEKNEISNN